MQIAFSPARGTTPLTLTRAGETLTVNGTPLDFSDLAEGESRPAEDYGCDLLVGMVTRDGGTLRLTLILPPDVAAGWLALFCLSVGGLGTWLLLRRLELSPPAALAGVVVQHSACGP